MSHFLRDSAADISVFPRTICLVGPSKPAGGGPFTNGYFANVSLCVAGATSVTVFNSTSRTQTRRSLHAGATTGRTASARSRRTPSR